MPPRYPPPPPVDLAAYAVEWTVEPVERYEKVAARKVSRADTRPALDQYMFPKTPPALAPSAALVAVLLEVPRRDVERVTMALRTSPKLYPSPDFLSACAEAASRLDDQTAVGAENLQLRELVAWVADQARDRGVDLWPEVHARIQSIECAGANRAEQVKAALTARQATLAADLLLAAGDLGESSRREPPAHLLSGDFDLSRSRH